MKGYEHKIQLGWRYHAIAYPTAYHNAKMISIATPRLVVTGSGNSLIGTRTEAVTPNTLFDGDNQEIIVLSTPAGTPFSSEKLNIYFEPLIKNNRLILKTKNEKRDYFIKEIVANHGNDRAFKRHF